MANSEVGIWYSCHTISPVMLRPDTGGRLLQLWAPYRTMATRDHVTCIQRLPHVSAGTIEERVSRVNRGTPSLCCMSWSQNRGYGVSEADGRLSHGKRHVSNGRPHGGYCSGAGGVPCATLLSCVLRARGLPRRPAFPPCTVVSAAHGIANVGVVVSAATDSCGRFSEPISIQRRCLRRHGL